MEIRDEVGFCSHFIGAIGHMGAVGKYRWDWSWHRHKIKLPQSCGGVTCATEDWLGAMQNVHIGGCEQGIKAIVTELSNQKESILFQLGKEVCSSCFNGEGWRSSRAVCIA